MGHTDILLGLILFDNCVGELFVQSDIFKPLFLLINNGLAYSTGME